jgi:WD40 repeat protein
MLGDHTGVPLPAQSALRLGTDRYRLGSRIECLSVSADNSRAATSSRWGTLGSSPRVFDLSDGRCLYSLPREPGSDTEAVALSPDGKILATKHANGLCIRDAATGKELRKITLQESGSGRTLTGWLTFTPDGKQVAATFSGNAIHLIDVGTGEVRRTFAPGEAACPCVFSPDGKLMAAGGYEKGATFAQLWEVSTGKELRRFAAGDSSIRSLAFSPDGATLAGGGEDTRLRLWEAATGKELKVFPKIGRSIQSVAFSPDGKTVAAAGDGVHLYDVGTGKERLQIARRARGLVFSSDGAVLTGAVSGAIYRWDAATGHLLTPTAAQDSAVEQILITPEGQRVFTRNEDGDVHVWDTVGGKDPRILFGGAERGVVLSPDGRWLAWAVEDNSVRTPDPAHADLIHTGSRVRLYDIATDRVIDQLPGIREEASVVAILPNGKTILTLDRRAATVRLWDIESGKEQRSFPVSKQSPVELPDALSWAELSTDGKTLAIGYNRADRFSIMFRGVTVRLWDVTSGKATHDFDGHVNSVNCIVFSSNGRLVVTCGENLMGTGRGITDRVHVWDGSTGRSVSTLHDADGQPIGAVRAAFAPDGRTLATASADGTIRLWEVATWQIRAKFRGHRDRVTALAFDPEGRLFSGGLDTVVFAWDVRPPRPAVKEGLTEAWDALAHSDAGPGFQAQGRFLAESGKAVEWFAARVSPARPPDPLRVKTLIADLDNGDFATRERATTELKELWPIAAAALREVVEKSTSAEARRRAEGLLEEMASTVTPPGELRDLRAAEVLEWIATKEARTLLLELTKGAPDARLTRDATAACKRLEARK